MQQEKLPPSQRWALSILRHPEAPVGKEFDDADLALGVGRDALVRRALSQLRGEYDEGKMTVAQGAHRIVEIVKFFGLEGSRTSANTPRHHEGGPGSGVPPSGSSGGR